MEEWGELNRDRERQERLRSPLLGPPGRRMGPRDGGAARTREHGVTLALKPMHPAAAAGCGFLTHLSDAMEWVDRFDHSSVRLSLDLWQFGHDPATPSLLPDLVPLTAIVQLADCCGLPSADRERLLPGQGTLRLGPLVTSLVEHGYTGDFEFEIMGEAVESLGYEEVLRQARLASAAWTRRLRVPLLK